MTLPKIPYYHIDSLLNSGGMANVYLGLDLRSGFPVAVKELFSNRTKDKFIIQNFRVEASLYCHLSHPNLTKLVDFVEYGDKCYLIMEFVDGKSLDVLLNTENKPLEEKKLVPVFCQILEAVAYIHQKRILHLDLKPGNIMLKDDGKIKILDMGNSARIDDNNLKNRPKIGSPAFMAPEQINQKELGFYSDIFALGVTFFNMLTGKLPFSGAGHTDIFEKICNEKTPLAKDFYPDVNPEFQKIINRALQKDGSKRYQTCEEFQMELLEVS